MDEEEKNPDQISKDEVDKQCVEVAVPIIVVIGKALLNSLVSFFMMRFLTKWWNKDKSKTEDNNSLL